MENGEEWLIREPLDFLGETDSPMGFKRIVKR